MSGISDFFFRVLSRLLRTVKLLRVYVIREGPPQSSSEIPLSPGLYTSSICQISPFHVMKCVYSSKTSAWVPPWGAILSAVHNIHNVQPF